MIYNNKQKYTLSIFLIFLLRSIDLYLTYLYIPDLKGEYNPLVSLIGASWSGLIIVQFILLCLIAFVSTFYFFKPRIIVKVKNLNFPDFIYCFFFEKLKPWPQRMFSMPKTFTPHLIFNGFMFISVAILISIFAIFNNTLLILDVNWYIKFLSAYYSKFFPTVFILIVLISSQIFFMLQYRFYLNDSKLH